MYTERAIKLEFNNPTGIKTYVSQQGLPGETDSLYIPIFDIDEFNPSYSTTYNLGGVNYGVYDDYEASISLVFADRVERAQFAQTTFTNLITMSVSTDYGKTWFFKSVSPVSIDFTEAGYIDGVIAKLRIKLYGRWTSALETVEVNHKETGATGKAFQTKLSTKLVYTYDEDLIYGNTKKESNEVVLINANKFIIVFNKSDNIQQFTLTSGKDGKTIVVTKKKLAGEPYYYQWNSFSSDLSTYSIDPANPVLSYGVTASTIWDFSGSYTAKDLHDLLLNSGTAGVTLTAIDKDGNAVPTLVYQYKALDFI